MVVSDKNLQAAKLFAENKELQAKTQALQIELKATPESMTTRISGLNELTSNLNDYLKEYLTDEGQDRLKKEHLELQESFEAIEQKLGEKKTKLQNLKQEFKTDKEAWEEEKATIIRESQAKNDQLQTGLDALVE